MSESNGWQRVSEERSEAEISSEFAETGKIFVLGDSNGQWQGEAFGNVSGWSDSVEGGKLSAQRLATDELEQALAQKNTFRDKEYPEKILREALAELGKLKP